VVADIAVGLGIAAADVLAAVEDPAWKARCREETDAAIARGVFGAPFIFVDGEPFWGGDRMWMVRKWLEGAG
jgi:2-hydroxychromene-2-carboxylate isomerase